MCFVCCLTLGAEDVGHLGELRLAVLLVAWGPVGQGIEFVDILGDGLPHEWLLNLGHYPLLYTMS